ncbi:DUF1003 domain-containing protein, partial [Candidatus Gottesmanbacteria bacterium]|nr:DUF1003 domain-containing protein [Candidatus Gottesmanbacteria bacterium]
MAEQNSGRSTRQIIRSLEAKALKKRSFSVRIADSLTSQFGSLAFFTANILFFSIWLGINLGYLQPAIDIFDPYPFILLTMIVSLEAIFLTIIVLMSQNRQSFISSLREELDLQVNLITERELTKALHLLSDIHTHLGVKGKEDPELTSMLKDIDTSYIERRLEDQLKGEQSSLPQVVKEPLVKLGQAV